MKGTITTGIPIPAVKRGLVWICLFALLGLAGAGIIHASLAGTSTGRRLAPAPGTGGGTDGGPTSVRTAAPAGALALYSAPGGGGGTDPGSTSVE
jgi:hypothetical protein